MNCFSGKIVRISLTCQCFLSYNKTDFTYLSLLNYVAELLKEVYQAYYVLFHGAYNND